MQKHHLKLVIGATLVSLLLHALSFVELGRFGGDHPLDFNHANKRPPVKIRVVEVPKKKPAKTSEPPAPDAVPKILELPQTKTATPDKADYVGNVDHQAKKETRISEKIVRDKAKDPGQKGNPKANSTPSLQPLVKAVAQDKPTSPEPKKIEKGDNHGVKSKLGKLSMDAFNSKPRNDYEALLPTGVNDLPGQMNAGFQDYVDDKVAESDRIDINTVEYRYIGYFTNMRKAIELVWNYPLEAARKGLQGEVGLEFTINKDGKTTRIRVIKSSGYPILDRAIVEAIKLASPFAPLPDGFRKNRLVVTGSFRYILSSH